MPTFCARICDSDADAIEAIRAACHALLPNWQNPHRFFEQRSEITSGLTKLLRLIGSDVRQLNGRPPKPHILPHQLRTQSTIRLAERTFGLAKLAMLAKAAQTPIQRLALPPASLLPPMERAVQHAPMRPARRHRYPMPPRGVNGQGVLL